jgi:hypothetical protein
LPAKASLPACTRALTVDALALGCPTMSGGIDCHVLLPAPGPSWASGGDRDLKARLFSSRRESITADLRARATRFEQRYGRAPSQREVAQLAQASNFATRRAEEGTLDAEQLHAGWADKLSRTLGVPLASVAPSAWHADAGRTHERPRDADATDAVPEELVLRRAAQQAVALAQQESSSRSLSRTSTLVLLLTYLRMRISAGLKPRSTAPMYRFRVSAR